MKNKQTLKQKWHRARNWAAKGALTRIITRLETMKKCPTMTVLEEEILYGCVRNLKYLRKNLKARNEHSWKLYQRRMKANARR